MKALFLCLVLFPLAALPEDSTASILASLENSKASPFVASGPDDFTALREHQGRGPDMSDWLTMYFAQQEALRNPGSPPTVIYHAQDPLDLKLFQLREAVKGAGNGTNTVEPHIIYEIGPGKR